MLPVLNLPNIEIQIKGGDDDDNDDDDSSSSSSSSSHSMGHVSMKDLTVQWGDWNDHENTLLKLPSRWYVCLKHQPKWILPSNKLLSKKNSDNGSGSKNKSSKQPTDAWSCNACTLLNPVTTVRCNACGGSWTPPEKTNIGLYICTSKFISLLVS
jgi:hypothetical protein